MKRLTFSSYFLVGVTLLLPQPAGSSLLPEQYQLVEAVPQTSLMDQSLAIWLSKHSLMSATGAPAQPLRELEQKTDEVSMRFAAMQAQLSGLKAEEKKRQLDELWALLQAYEKLEGSHPLRPYIVAFYYQAQQLQKTRPQEYLEALIQDPVGMSCPGYQFLHGRLTDRHFINAFPAVSKTLLAQLAISHNLNAQMQTAKTFFRLLDKSKHSYFKEGLAHLRAKNPLLKDAFAEVLAPQGRGSQQPAALSEKLLKQVGQLAERQDCGGARLILQEAIQAPASRPPLSNTLVSLEKLGQCFRRVGAGQRTRMWQSFSRPFQEAYGYAGWTALSLRLARYQWSDDQFAEARATLALLWKESLAHKDADTQAQTLFLQARINENQQLISEAIKSYRQFIHHFPLSPHYEEALIALMLNFAGMGHWLEAYEITRQIIVNQEGLSEDERHVSVMGLALFWAGRAAIEIGKREEGIAHWQRLANDYFSSYYGAAGHYMLEQLTGKRYVLQPLHNRAFPENFVVSAFAGTDRQRVLRIQSLLRLGFKSEAHCETLELSQAEHSPEQQLARVLLLYAADDWVEAIKLFGNLPRSYRKSLPYGMEKLLFPRKYEDRVQHYAAKMGLDPAFVFSIIRQESVFDPEAFSPAGARGLMQLMHKTAQLQARRLPLSYVSHEEKQGLFQKVQGERELFDPETNIILGVHYLHDLLSRHKHVPEALAAYNAGPAVVSRWQQRYPGDDPFYFIERIPYNETRDYVRLVLRNYFYYKRWYAGPFAELPHLDHLTGNLLAFRKAKGQDQIK